MNIPSGLRECRHLAGTAVKPSATFHCRQDAGAPTSAFRQPHARREGYAVGQAQRLIVQNEAGETEVRVMCELANDFRNSRKKNGPMDGPLNPLPRKTV
ncbi:MAG: hypothetical protein ACRER2_09640 [Methylococcales bacterium]